MILRPADGTLGTSGQEQQLQAAGYHKCYGRMPKGQPCPYWLSPQTVASVEQAGGYYTCPTCRMSFDLLEHLPWHGVTEENHDREQFEAGGTTRIGLGLTDQGQIGEDLIRDMGQLPGYGPITWWHEGTAGTPSPLDGATAEWGIEVKTLGYDARHHRFIPGRTSEKQAKNAMAAQRGYKGVLGVLVLLDYRRSVADIYVKEMPLAAWSNGAGRTLAGVSSFRSSSGQHLIAEIPFKNPFMSPEDPAPVKANPEVPF